MTPPRILPSTTSHKNEPLLPTLEVFSRLGLRDIDLNLGHLIEGGVPVETLQRALRDGGQRVWIVSGGWCDFFHRAPRIDETFASVDRQVHIARQLGVREIRLFFGRLARERYSAESLEIIADNLAILSARYPDMTFMFENHGDGASGQPDVCRDVLQKVDRLNVRLNFDPINFEYVGVKGADALSMLQPLVGHVHLKGLEEGEFCEFGSGTVDLTPVLRSLLDGGYRGTFTVEYEGPFDKTLRLYQSVQRAAAALDKLVADRPSGC
jgi:sugar phosphate isomerase/epimerase